MRVLKWGNSLAVHLPVEIVEALDLHEGDDIAFFVADERTIEDAQKAERSELLTRLRVFRGRLPADFRFDRDVASAR